MINISAAGRGAALAAAAALTLTTAGTAVAAEDAGVQSKASKGTLDWGVKESFRDYVEGAIADGGIDVTKPAKRLGDGTFRWAKGKGKVDTDADTAKITFKGSVYFYGHDDGTGPQLEITVDKPRLVIDGDESVLIADVTSRGFDGSDPVLYDDIELVTVDTTGLDLEVGGGVVRASDLPTEITADGAVAFVGFYSEGTAFDPLSFKVKVRG